MSKISVVFWTQGGNTESMANAVVEGIKEAGKEGLNPRYFRQKALSFVGIGGCIRMSCHGSRSTRRE